MVIKKVCQGIGLLLLIGVLFLGLSVSVYSPDDPNGNFYASQGQVTVQSRGRAAVAGLADWTLQAFGSAVVLLAGLAGVGAWCLLRGRVTTAVAVAWRGLLCLAAVSASVHLIFTRDPMYGTAVFVGGFLASLLESYLRLYLSSSLSRPGTYIVLGLVALGALCIGGKHPIRTALWRGLRTVGHWSRELVLAVQQMVARIGGVIRQGEAVASRLSGVVTRPWRLDTRPPSISLPPEVHERTAPWGPPFPAATPAGAREEETKVARSTPPVRQGHVLPARPPDALPRQHPPVVATPAYGRRPRQQRATDMLPSFDLLDAPASSHQGHSAEELDTQARFLEQKLREFGVEGEVVQVLPGPVITMYEFAPAAGVKVSKIVNLQDDLALVMQAVSVRVVAPIPGKAVVGIEIPHQRRETVRLREVLDSEEFRTSMSKLSMVLGKDILGRPVITDLALIPHLLIAGATGSGKSVGLNSLICSLLFRATPADVRMIMIDPKMLEFSVYDGIPHLLVPVVTDPKKAAGVLRRVVEEMGRRYQVLAERGVRSIAQYNQGIEEAQRQGPRRRPQTSAEPEASPVPAEKLPYLVVVIDELSDLMMVSTREVEDSLMRLAQMARAAGIHLIVATQRPSVDVLTGVIKANFPARLSFQVTSKVDSRTILDTNGAETLLGRGDMLFLAPGTSKPQRVHGAYVSEAEIDRLVAAWKAVEQTRYDAGFLAPVGEQVNVEEDEYDEKYDDAVALVTKTRQASISMLQRRLRVGYNRAARMIEMMEKEGIVGPADGVKPREVLGRNSVDDV